MKVDDFIDAMGKVDAKYVAEAQEAFDEKKSGKRRMVWKARSVRRALSFAACVAVLTAGGFWFHKGTMLTTDNSTVDMLEESAEGNPADSIAEESTAENQADAASAFYKNSWNDVASAEAEGEVSDDVSYKEEVMCPQSACQTDDVGNLSGARREEGVLTQTFLRLAEQGGFVQQGAEESLEQQEAEEPLEQQGAVRWEFEREEGGRFCVVESGNVVSRFGNLLENKDVKISTWKGTKVAFLQIDEEEHYLAQYRSGDDYVEVEAEEISETEFLELLEALLCS